MSTLYQLWVIRIPQQLLQIYFAILLQQNKLCADNCNKMDHAPISRVCIPVKFNNESKYCDIALTYLTRESFFDDGEKINLIVFVRLSFFLATSEFI